MIAIFISWIVISIVFLSFGDLCIFLYNRIGEKKESYGITDTFLIGMCFTLIPLAATSLWLPVNQYVMFSYILFSFLYWIVRKEHAKQIINKVKNYLKKISFFHYLLIAIPIISLMIAILWQIGTFDSLFYHQQQIRWNEEYAIVPGLSNLEDRFGFNSNYLLLSALFSFRFLFGEAVYSIHVLVLAYILSWIIVEIIKSDYEIRRIILLIVFTGYIFVFGHTFTATSTDSIPNTVSFYLIAKLLLYPNSIKSDKLLWVIIPVTMITFKVTILPLCLISVHIIYSLLKEKEYNSLTFLLIVSTLILCIWLVRNIILTGYLMFPFHEIDLFLFDWEIPKYVAQDERDFILSCGKRVLNQEIIPGILQIPKNLDSLKWWINSFIFIGFICLSPIFIIYSLIRKKYINKQVYIAYIILILIFGIWYLGGPDPRFIGGTIFAMMYLIFFLILSTKKEKHYPKLGLCVIISFAIIMGTWAIKRTNTFCKMFDLYTEKPKVRSVFNVFVKQYPYRESLKSMGFYVDDFTPYHMNENIIIYMSRSTEIPDGRYVCFDNPFPCSVFIGDKAIKYLDVTEIEPRGFTLQEGFRPIK